MNGNNLLKMESKRLGHLYMTDMIVKEKYRRILSILIT